MWPPGIAGNPPTVPPALAHRTRCARVSAEQGGSHSDSFESELSAAAASFPKLASVVAGKLASEVAGQEGAFNRLAFW